MITREDIEQLCHEQVREAIESSLMRRPTDVALDRRIPSAALVATQVKYLQRAKAKLPSYYAARCILPPRAFEQSSSEATAAIKRMEGGRCLELTAGLGVDTLHLAQRFGQVISIERDEVLATVTRENMRRLGVHNVEIIASSAEEYLASCSEKFDWVYVDPDRRGTRGEKLFRLEECSPNILLLLPAVARLGARLAIKLSPLFDVTEAQRLFPDAHIEVVSLGGECKEVVIYTGGGEASLSALAVGRGAACYRAAEVDRSPYMGTFVADDYRYLVIPDVALITSRLACHHLRGVADMWSENGFGFARQYPEGVMGRVLEIERIEPFDPKRLKRELKGEGVELLRRDMPLSSEQLIKQLRLKPGGQRRVAFTSVNNRLLTIFLDTKK